MGLPNVNLVSAIFGVGTWPTNLVCIAALYGVTPLKPIMNDHACTDRHTPR